MNIVWRYAPFRIFDNQIGIGNHRLHQVADQNRDNRNRLIAHSVDYSLTKEELDDLAESVINFLNLVKNIYASPTIVSLPSTVSSPSNAYVQYINNGGNFLP